LNKKELVKSYIKKKRYFSLSQIVEDTGLKRKLAKDYLSQLKIERAVFDAGYGYFSSIPERFVFPRVERVDEIKRFVKNEFPEVDFLVWDTKIFAPFYHHTQTHHITFAEVEKEVLFSVHEKLYGKYRNVLKEARTRDFFERFDVRRDPIVVRGLLSRSPREDHEPSLEKVLVDMLVDLDKYKYIGRFDYFELWRDMIRTYRINIGSLYNYSKRRRCAKTLISELIDNKNSYAIDFCHILKEIGKGL
jgi:hypothetical protein